LTGGPAVPATDVYALALLMFRLLTGEQPRAVTDATSRPPSLPRLPGVPLEVVDLYRRGVQNDPRRRPSAREAAAVLRSAGRHDRPAAPIRPSAVRTPALIAACLAVLAALILVVMNRPAGPASAPQEPAPVQT
jgi:serine/threonine-protein kinase